MGICAYVMPWVHVYGYVMQWVDMPVMSDLLLQSSLKIILG